jgi:NarL family two-component system sensor histidine kinase LiaS
MRSYWYPDAIGTRTVFYAYAALACVGGFALASWGGLWFGVDMGGERWAKVALIRVFGTILVGAGLLAIAFAKVEDPSSRRRGLAYFAAAHGVVSLMLYLQVRGPWGEGLGSRAGYLLLGVTMVLFWLWFTADKGLGWRVQTITSLFGGTGQPTTEQLRSEYEQQIRRAASQEERARLARDLHDSIKQQIFVIQTSAATVEARLDEDKAGAREALGLVRTAARDAMSEMEAMLDQLRAVPLENAGLIEALKKQCEALGLRTGAEVEFQHESLPSSTALAPGTQDTVFRVAQEALSNIARHARATRVAVYLTAGGGRLHLMIRDNGAGFDLEKQRRGMGIGNMFARAAEIGGALEVDSRPGGGTKVVLSVPYRTTTARDYKIAAWISGIATILALILLRRQPPNMLIVIVLAGTGFVSYLLAYRKIRKEETK